MPDISHPVDVKRIVLRSEVDLRVSIYIQLSSIGVVLEVSFVTIILADILRKVGSVLQGIDHVSEEALSIERSLVTVKQEITEDRTQMHV